MSGAQRAVYYIAGPMNGTEDMGRSRFNDAAKRLSETLGVAVLNPACLPLDMPSDRYMPICLAMVREADVVYMLKGWKNSPGARLEASYAQKCGKEIVFEGAV